MNTNDTKRDRMYLLRQITGKSLTVILGLFPFALLNRLYGKVLLLPFYHVVSNERVIHVINLFSYNNTVQFEKDLDFFQKYFRPVSLSDVMNHLHGKATLPDKAFLLTFDDGHREAFDVIAPILRKRNIPAVFFLNSRFIDNRDMSFRFKASLIVDALGKPCDPQALIRVSSLLGLKDAEVENMKKAVLSIKFSERHLLSDIAGILNISFSEYCREEKPYVTSDEVRSLLADGFDIGAHSVDHPLFNELALNEQLSQVNDCFSELKRQFPMKYNAFAFPFHDKGVDNEFFNKTHGGGIIDISFGTSGLTKGHCPNNLQRQPMEGHDGNADMIYKQLFRSAVILKVIDKLHLR